MTSRMVALRILDGIFIAANLLALLVIAGLPMEWLLALAEMSLREFQWFAIVIVFAALWLIHAIATSNAAPRVSLKRHRRLRSKATSFQDHLSPSPGGRPAGRRSARDRRAGSGSASDHRAGSSAWSSAKSPS
jgi:hypothetical protein